MAATEVPWAKKTDPDLDTFDIDDLLSKLTEDDISALQEELFDPDVSLKYLTFWADLKL